MAAIRTYDGRLVDPFSPKDSDVRPRIMLRALSQINRFTGQGQYPYNVAKHEYNLYKWAERKKPHLKKAALAHDLAESWFNDLASPVKARNKVYKRHEHKATLFVASVLGVSEAEIDELSIYDKKIYINERNALFPTIERKGMGDEQFGLDIPEHFFLEESWDTSYFKVSNAFIAEFGSDVYNR